MEELNTPGFVDMGYWFLLGSRGLYLWDANVGAELHVLFNCSLFRLIPNALHTSPLFSLHS